MDAATGPFDSDQCKEMLGADFDQTAFDALKDAEGKVTHAQITAALAEAAALAAGGALGALFSTHKAPTTSAAVQLAPLRPSAIATFATVAEHDE